MPEIEIEDSVSPQKFCSGRFLKMRRESFYTASVCTSKSMLFTCNVSGIHALQVVWQANDHARQILHY